MAFLLAGAVCAGVSIGALSSGLGWAMPQVSMSPLSTASVPPETMVINGGEHPERIPDHWVWRSVFLKLAEIAKAGAQGDLSRALPLSAGDAQVLYREAGLQARRDDDCAREIQSRQEELRERRVPPEEATRAIDDVTIGCRTRDLDAGDRVVDELSEEGRIVLQAWLDQQRRGMTVFVPERQIRVFRLPR
jgi:hypothetical protein